MSRCISSRGRCWKRAASRSASSRRSSGRRISTWQFLGEAGHAGTVPMRLRRDALAGAAEAMMLGETLARETEGEVRRDGRSHRRRAGRPERDPRQRRLHLRHPLRLGAARAKFAEHLKAACARSPTGAISGLTITSRATSPPRLAIRMQDDLPRRSARSARNRCGLAPAPAMTGRRWPSCVRSACCSCAAAAASATTRWNTRARRPRPRGRGADRASSSNFKS